MRKVVVRAVSEEPTDEEGLDRLMALLATGLERLLSREQAGRSDPKTFDYPQTLSPTSNEDTWVSKLMPETKHNRSEADQGHEVRRVALVVRGSTDRQAMTEEGSLKNQLQRLRAHLDYKSGACGEQWQESAVYELRAISGKDSMRSQEFQQLFRDIQSRRVNTVLCTALDRISR